MKFTLLEIVQDILNDISGDEVDSITDTVEAGQIANIVRSTYFYIVSQKNLPEHKSIYKLTETSATTPTVMTLPTTVLTLDEILYDHKVDPGAFSGGVFSGSAFDVTEASNFTPVQYMSPNDFLAFTGSFTWDNDVVDAFVFTGTEGTHDIKYRTDKSPSYYTVLEDYYIIFDGIHTDISPDYALADLTMCYGTLKPIFALSDSFTPDLDATEFSLLIEESKRAASVKIRQARDPIAEERSRKGWIRLNPQAENVDTGPAYKQYPKYGRKN